jgi:hypothetical protein
VVSRLSAVAAAAAAAAAARRTAGKSFQSKQQRHPVAQNIAKNRRQTGFSDLVIK